MTFWKTQHFKALQKAWYRRLEDEGFADAEEMIAGELVLKQTAQHCYRGTDEITRESKEGYFRLMASLVQEAEFTSEVDKIILTRYAEGKKIKVILEELTSMGKRRCRGTIRYKIRTYEMRWGMREYTPQQLNKKVQRVG